MKTSPTSLSAHRAARIVRWAQLHLLRAAAWIVHVAGISAPLTRAVERALKPALAKMTMLALALIVLRAHALEGAKARTRKGGRPRRDYSVTLRSLAGSELRRLARAKDMRARIAALGALFTHAEMHAARLAKRFARGLTRRRGGVKPEMRTLQIESFAAFTFAGVDTS